MDIFGARHVIHFLIFRFKKKNPLHIALCCKRPVNFERLRVCFTEGSVLQWVCGWVEICDLQHAILAGRWAVAFPRADRLIKFCSAPRYSGHDWEPARVTPNSVGGPSCEQNTGQFVCSARCVAETRCGSSDSKRFAGALTFFFCYVWFLGKTHTLSLPPLLVKKKKEKVECISQLHPWKENPPKLCVSVDV